MGWEGGETGENHFGWVKRNSHAGMIEPPKFSLMPGKQSEFGTLRIIIGVMPGWHRRCLRDGIMKKIEAIIQRSKLNQVTGALEDMGVDGMTVCEVKGFGRQNRHKESYRSKEYTIHFLPMIKIDFVVADENLEQVVKVVTQSAKTGAGGDGKILISEVKEAAYALAI